MSETTVDYDWSMKSPGPFVQPRTRKDRDESEGVFKPPIAILGINFDPLTSVEAVSRIEQMVLSRRPHHLVTANLDFVVQAIHDVELRHILLEAHLVLCDGMPLVWASRLLGNPLPERVAGSDLVPRLLRVAAEKGYRPFFLGGAPEVTAQAVVNLKARFPTLDVAGYYSPPVRPLLEMDHEEILRRIHEARPDLLFVSLGCPKAEKWLAMHYRSLGVPVTVGVGATIDFLAGRVKRAPVWMRRAGIEWVYRLWQEPGRLVKRYATDLWYFAQKMPGQWLHLQCRGAIGFREAPALDLTANLAPNPTPAPAPTPNLPRASDHSPPSRMANNADLMIIAESWWLRLRMPRNLDRTAVQENASIWSQISQRHCLLELEEVEFIDSTGVGLLLWLRRQLRAARRELVLLAPSACVRRALRVSGLKDVFLVAPDAAEARRLIQESAREQPDFSRNGSAGVTQPLFWQGEVTAGNADPFWELIQAQLAHLNGHHRNLVVDLSELRFIDSTGLGLLLRAKKEAAGRRVDLRFVNAHSNVRNVLRLAHVEELLADRWSRNKP